MQRWIIFGLVIMLAFVVIANLSGPRAWASGQGQVSVPTRTPRPSGTRTFTPRPTKPPKNGPTNTPRPAETGTPSTSTIVAKTVTPRTSITATHTIQPSDATLTPTLTVTVSATPPVELTSTATSESSSIATTVASSASDSGAAEAPAQVIPNVEQVSSPPAGSSSNFGLSVIAAVLLILGAVLLFGHHKENRR